MSSSASSAAISGSETLAFSPDIESNASFSGQEVYHGSNGHRPSLKSRSSIESIELPEEVITMEGLRHCDMVLNAKRYKKEQFLDKLLEILQELRVPTWSDRTMSSNASIKSFSSTSTLAWDLGPPDKSKVKIFKVSGSFTNAVFFISVPSSEGYAALAHKTLLLRIYGPSTSSLINRVAELRILHVLSSRYRIGPRVYGTFGNGRVEEYFESEALLAASLRDPQISRWIAVRMSELHRVDVRKVVDPVEWADPVDGTRGELGVKRYMRSWIPAAQEVLKLVRDGEYKKTIDFDLFVEQWTRYYQWVRDWEKENGEEKQSPRVFCHNDTQCGNLLMLKEVPPGKLPHQRIIVVDFEYASPNPAAFDIANQFCEWTSNYVGPHPELQDLTLFPTRSQRDNFYLAYLQSGLVLDSITGDSAIESPLSSPATSRRSSSAHLSTASTPAKTPPIAQFTPMTQMGPSVSPEDMELLEQQVTRWVPASHGLWAMWAIVQARDNVEQQNMKLDGQQGEDDDVPMEFDYLQYASGRIKTFRDLCQSMGVF